MNNTNREHGSQQERTLKDGKQETASSSMPMEDSEKSELQALIGPPINEFRSLRESMDKKYTSLEEKYSKLEDVIGSQNEVVTSDIQILKIF